MGEIGIPSKMGSNGFRQRVCVEAIKSPIFRNLPCPVWYRFLVQVGGIAIKVLPLLMRYH